MRSIIFIISLRQVECPSALDSVSDKDCKSGKRGRVLRIIFSFFTSAGGECMGGSLFFVPVGLRLFRALFTAN